jgi:hypothetical protein
MKYIIVEFEDYLTPDTSNTAGIITFPDTIKAESIIDAIENVFRAGDLGYEWDTLEAFLADQYGDTVQYVGYEGIAYI